MNKINAKKIAQTVTMEQLQSMFDRVEREFTDWESVSAVNKGISKGAAWNILKAGFDSMNKITDRDRNLGVKNMIWEFGDYLSDDLKIKKKRSFSEPKQIHHQNPKF